MRKSSTYDKDVQESNQRIANIFAIPGFSEKAKKYLAAGGDENGLAEKVKNGDFGAEAQRQAKAYDRFVDSTSYGDYQKGLDKITEYWRGHSDDVIGDVLVEHTALDMVTGQLKSVGITVTFNGYSDAGPAK